MGVRDRIKLGCIAIGLKQVDIAEKIGTSKQEIAHVASGRYRSGRVVDGIAQVLGCSVEWLIDGTGDAPPWAAQPPRAAEPTTIYEPMTVEPRELPVIGTVGAADGGQRGVLFERPEIKRLPSKIAAVAVRGGSAYPVAYDGQWVLVNKDGKVRHNNLVVVVLEDNDEVLVKRWCEQADGEHIALASPDGGRDSLVVHRHQVRHVWRVVGTYYD